MRKRSRIFNTPPTRRDRSNGRFRVHDGERIGPTADQELAVEWYRRAAESGDGLGENNLADSYLRGLGVPQSDELAAAWFQKAADQGQTGARIKLGYLYMVGAACTRVRKRVTAGSWRLHLPETSVETNIFRHCASNCMRSNWNKPRDVRKNCRPCNGAVTATVFVR
jgi:hypothetical protein